MNVDFLTLFQLAWLAERHLSQLSCGQCPRIVLARAGCGNPRCCCATSAFDALDANVRKE